MMRRSGLIIVGVCAAVVAAWCGIAWPREPKYVVHTADYWFQAYCSSPRQRGTAFHARAEKALEALGTNALPTLLDYAMRPDDPTGHKLREFMDKVREKFGMEKNSDAKKMSSAARRRIIDLNAPTGLLVALMGEQLKDTNSPLFYDALAILDPFRGDLDCALPYLIRGLDSTISLTRVTAVGWLEELGPKAVPAIPALMRQLEITAFTNRDFQNYGNALAAIGSNSAPALPLLMHAFDTDTDCVRRCAHGP